MSSSSKKKRQYNVLAVYYLREFAGRDQLAGLLDEMSNKMNWHLDTVRPGRFFTERELENEDGEPFDGYILSMPGTDAVMKRIAASRAPTVLVNITDRQLSARSDAVASVWTDNADARKRISPERFFDRLREWVRDLPKPAAVMACSDMRAAKPSVTS